MFRSIRWRLIASYVLLTLLTVSSVGMLALSLVKQYVEQRAAEDLTANAEAVARQALPLMRPARSSLALRELAQTSAFLGNARVRILDERQRMLVDSGSPSGVDQFMWLTPPIEFGIESLDHSWMMVIPSTWSSALQVQDVPFFLEQLPPDTEWIIAHRTAGAWGIRFTFEGMQNGQRLTSPVIVEAIPERESLDEEPAPRSERAVTVPIGEANRPLGYVELSSGPDFGAEALDTTRRAFLLAGGGAMALAVVVGLLVSHGLTAPLRSLTAVAGRMSDDLSTRAPVRGKDEIGRLAHQLNRMAGRLETSFAELAAERDALRRFIADASHELRTPVTALKNFNELLQGAATDDPAAHAEFLDESAVQLDRLEWITHNLLDLSRLDAGLIALELARQDVGELIEAASAAFQVLAQEKGIAFSIRPPHSPLTLECDRARVELALSNLLDNAFKFTPPGGRVEIGAEAISDEAIAVSLEDAGESVRLWVQDDGPGVDPADQPHIFERFYRGRGSRTEGSGLGLAIVQSVVQAHGGRVGVESEPEAGSRFVIELPTGV
jgi:signal transduction histidine kinase